MPKLSIITITYNNLIGLQKTAQSILIQTYHDFEWVIVDGASTDGTKDYLTSIRVQWKDPQERLIIFSEPDKGVYDAMNKGVKMAIGTYCLFLNSGDYLADNRVLETAVQWLDGADVYYGDAVFEQGDNRLERTYPDRLTWEFFYNDSLCHQAIFYKRERLLRSGGYDEAYRLIADWVLNLRLFRGRYHFVHIPLSIAHYDMQGLTSGTNGYEACQKERALFYQRNRLWYIHQWMWIKRKFRQLFTTL